MGVAPTLEGQRVLLLLILSIGIILASPLPMTDYSQLNHDEPTHWTKPATTPTEQQVVKLETGTTERTGSDSVTTNVFPITQQETGESKNGTKVTTQRSMITSESGSTSGDDLVAVGAVESFEKDGSPLEERVPLMEEAFLPLGKDELSDTIITLRSKEKNGNPIQDKTALTIEAPTASIGTIRIEVGNDNFKAGVRNPFPPAYGTPILEAGDNYPHHDAIDKLARNRDELGGAVGVPELQARIDDGLATVPQDNRDTNLKEPKELVTDNGSLTAETESLTTPGFKIQEIAKNLEPLVINFKQVELPQKNFVQNIRKRNGTTEFETEKEPIIDASTVRLESTKQKLSTSEQTTITSNNTDFFKDQNTDFTSEIASIEAKDDTLINNIIPIDRDDQTGKNGQSTTKGPDDSNTEQFFRYDIIEDIRNLFSNDNDMNENDAKENQLEDVLGFKGEDKVPTEDTLIVQRIEDGGYENGFLDEDQRSKEEKRVIDSLVVPTMGEKEVNYEAPFSEWDRESEEQDRNMENIVFQMGNESEMAALDLSNKANLQGGSWFLLLLSGNATIVQKRQKDFAKYLKLNLAARLSLEYDELKVNKVVLAPPRLMVNVSVIPSENDNFDEEFDLTERLFGEEEAPLHKLAETNATLLELSGEEYHVVRFLSLRSAQPMTMEEAAVDEGRQISDKHGDIEYLIYIIVGGPCLTLIVFLIYTLYRLYLLPKNDWPWQRDKPIFSTGPRHQRMNDTKPFAKPLTVIYSGSFVDRNGPPSGSWLDENYRPEVSEKVEPSIENPSYGLGSLSKTALSEICEPSVLDSPRFNVRMMGCQPAHLLLPRTPVKKIADLRPSRGLPLPKGLDNPNYLT